MSLSVPQIDFVGVLLETGSRATAAKRSGISADSAMAVRAVEKAVRDGLAQRLLAIAPRALLVMESLATDPAIPPAVRRLAAADLLDRAGLVSQAALKLAQPIESLSEMPASALRGLVERLESELFARSKPVRALEFEAPVGAAIEPKPLSVLD